MRYKAGLTPLDVADILKISKNTVYEMARRGEINSYRVGNKVRFDIEDIEEYKNKNYRGDHKHRCENYIFQDAPCRLEEQKKNSFIICGQDVMLNTLCRHLLHQSNGILALNSYVGSYTSLYELYYGNAQVATAHLWDGDTGEYNIPYVKKMMPGVPALIIRLAKRKQGMYVLKGNPKNIKGWEDLRRADISIINREIGSGTRILLDEHLKILGVNGANIEGYNKEYLSYAAMLSGISKGDADIAIGMEGADQQIKGVEFIPLQSESFDLIIKKEDMNKVQFQTVMHILQSKEFRLEVENMVGYDLSELGGIVDET